MSGEMIDSELTLEFEVISRDEQIIIIIIMITTTKSVRV
jgi:hypothetical protein